MLVEFSVENYRSFKERASLSLIAAKLRAQAEEIDANNVIRVNDKLALLRSVVVYGANASGKSNLAMAFQFMRRFVVESARGGLADSDIPVDPFRLSTSTVDQPSIFEVVFLLDGVQHRYGFAATKARVCSEWLYFAPSRGEAELFTREMDSIHIGKRFREGRGIEIRTRKNALFLSVVAQFNGHVAQQVCHWFEQHCRVLTTIDDEAYLPFTTRCIDTGIYSDTILELVRHLNIGVRGLVVEEVKVPDKFAETVRHLQRMRDVLVAESGPQRSEAYSLNTIQVLRTVHAVRDDNGVITKEESFPLQSMESQGTQKVIALLGPLVDVLTNGWTLFIDEIDARLHPLMTSAFISLFNSPDANPKGAQLVCNTHDTNLLDRRRFRRDQIYFTEKDSNEATRLYSLAEFKLPRNGGGHAIRNDASFEKDYIVGRYGAIPYLGDLNRLFIEEQEVKVHGRTAGLHR